MLLKITQTPALNDNTEKNTSSTAVKIQLEHGDSTDDFIIDSMTFPFSDNFYNDLDWYFQQYPLQVVRHRSDADEPLDRGIVEKLLRLGQHLGDEFLGEDHQLIRIKETIEEHGYENLNVQIKAIDDGFIESLWELAILPESKYVLSCVSKGYARQFTDINDSSDYPELEYDLKPPPAKPAAGLEHLYQADDNTPQPDQDDTEPLRIMHIVSRPNAIELPFSASNAFNQCLSSMSAEGAIDYQIINDCNWGDITTRLQDSKNPVHIVHYDGPVLITDDSASLLLTRYHQSSNSIESEELGIDKVASTLASHKVAALCIDARVYLSDNNPITARQGLRILAKQAAQNGLGNVIGLAHITDPWTSSQCFSALYAQLPLGLSLGQAVVESRKRLQANTGNPLIAHRKHPFSAWPLLVHYGGQTVTFFNNAAPSASLEECQLLRKVKEPMHGFHEHFLPPKVFSTSDTLLLRLLSAFDNTQINSSQASENQSSVYLWGEQGIGKTHLVHRFTFYLMYNRPIDFAFYFDYDIDFYSNDIIIEMIAPVFELNRDTKEHVIEKLQNTRCVFVLDNIHKIQKQNDTLCQPLSELLNTLQTQGHFVVAIGQSPTQNLVSTAIDIELGPMPSIEQTMLLDHTLSTAALDDKKATLCCDDSRFLSTINGNPWLIEQSVSLLKATDFELFLQDFEQHIKTNADTSRIEQFYEWRWAALKPLWRHLLLITLDIDGLILEMFLLAFNQDKPTDAAKSLLSNYQKDDGNNDSNDRDSNNSVADFLPTLKSSGFTSETTYGTKIDSRCLRFLSRKKQSAQFESLRSDNTLLLCSNIVATGLTYLSRQAVTQQHSVFQHYLLMNRRQWAVHLERLWFAKDYRAFMEVKSSFDQVLLQAKLGEESAAWGLDMLQRSAAIPGYDSDNQEAQAAWLQMASFSSLHSNDNNALPEQNTQILHDTAKLWQSWLDDIDNPVPKESSALFHGVVNFLDVFYNRFEQWDNCINVNKKAHAFYTEHQAWQKVIQSAKTIIRCMLQKDDSQTHAVLDWENKILNDIPYKDAPPNFKSQQMLDIVMSRLVRQETTLAQTLLDELKTQDDAEQLGDVLDGVQADICFQKKEYLQALPHYLTTWQKMIQSEQQQQIAPLKTRLLEIEEAVGADVFDRCFESNVSPQTPNPRDL